MKVCLVGSSGGHLTHLYMLKPFWENKDRFWVTFDKEDVLMDGVLYLKHMQSSLILQNSRELLQVAQQVRNLFIMD